MYQVRPFLKSNVSLVEVEITSDIKVVDFTKYDMYGEEKTLDDALYTIISSMYYIPIDDNTQKLYMITQYIAEYMKKLGYDGIKYRSSLSYGNNFALFDDEKTNIGSSQVLEIKSFTIKAN